MRYGNHFNMKGQKVMKKFVPLLFILCLLTTSGYSQQASGYFPTGLGHVWTYKQIPLDTLNNPVDSLITYSMDSLAAERTFQGLNAKVLLSKSGPAQTIKLQPWLDTNYVNFNLAMANIFFRIPSMEALIGQFDTTGYGQYLATLMEFYGLLKSFEKWYGMYDFQKAINQEYLIFQFDTTVTLDSTPVRLRLDLKEKRLNDDIIFTDFGTFDCKKFQENITISYVVQLIPPPFPPIVYPIFTEVTYIWFAPNEWEVRRETPANTINLSLFGYGTFSIPGRIKELTYPVSSVEEGVPELTEFMLSQNYPNPFNPSTAISYNLAEGGNVLLELYNVMGEKIRTLQNEEKSAGSHRFNFDSTGLASGVYFYKLTAGKISRIKKMTLLR